MRKICDIHGNARTVWTLAIHPYDSNLIATGNLGGQVSVFKNCVRIKNVYHCISKYFIYTFLKS